MFDGDATVLLNNPGLVADSWLNLASAIWFFLTPQAPKPAMLHVIDRTWVPSQRELAAGIGYGFGTTINIINGGIEVRRAEQEQGPAGQPHPATGRGLRPTTGSRCWRTRRTPAGSRSPMAASTSTAPPTCSTPTGTATGNTTRTDPAATPSSVIWWGTRPPIRPWCRGLREVRDQLLRLPRQLAQVRVVATLDPAPVDPGTPLVDGVPAWEAGKVYTAGNKVSHKGSSIRPSGGPRATSRARAQCCSDKHILTNYS